MPPKGGSSNRANPSRRRGSTPRGGGGARGHVCGGGNVADPGRVLAFDTPESGDLGDEESDSSLDRAVKRAPKPVEHRVESAPENQPSSQDSSYEREGQPARSTGEPIYGFNGAGEWVATPGNTLGYEVPRPIQVGPSLSGLAYLSPQQIIAEASKYDYAPKRSTQLRQVSTIADPSRSARSPIPPDDSLLIGELPTSALAQGGRLPLPQPTDSEEPRGRSRIARVDHRNAFQWTESDTPESARSQARSSSLGDQADVDSDPIPIDQDRPGRPSSRRGTGPRQERVHSPSSASMGRRKQQDPSGDTYMDVRRWRMADDPVRPPDVQTSDKSASTPPQLHAAPGNSDQGGRAMFRSGPDPPRSVQPVMAGLSSITLPSVPPVARVQYSTSSDSSFTTGDPGTEFGRDDAPRSRPASEAEASERELSREAPIRGNDSQSTDSRKRSSRKSKKKGGPKAQSDNDAGKRPRKPDDGAAGAQPGKKVASAW